MCANRRSTGMARPSADTFTGWKGSVGVSATVCTTSLLDAHDVSPQFSVISAANICSLPSSPRMMDPPQDDWFAGLKPAARDVGRRFSTPHSAPLHSASQSQRPESALQTPFREQSSSEVHAASAATANGKYIFTSGATTRSRRRHDRKTASYLSSSRPGSKNRPESGRSYKLALLAFGSMERRALLLLVMLRRQRRVRAP